MRLFLFALFFLAATTAALELPPQFSDNLVLQQGVRNAIWGKRTLNSKAEVWLEYQFPGMEKSKFDEASVGADSTWRAELPILKGPGPGSIWIWEGKKDKPIGDKITLKNIMIGDVWILALPDGPGFAKAPPKNPAPNLRILQLPTAGSLFQSGAPPKSAWAPLDSFAQLDVLATQLGLTLHNLGQKNPIGLVVISTENLAPYFPAKQWNDLSPQFLPAVKEALNDARQEIRAQRKSNEIQLIQLKHRGEIGSRQIILPYPDFVPSLLNRKTNDWRFKGLIYPISGVNR